MEENNATMSITRRCVIAVLCERTSLFLLVTGYTLLGAIIFKAIEGGEPHDVPDDFKKSREDCLKELWMITGSIEDKLSRKRIDTRNSKLNSFHLLLLHSAIPNRWKAEKLLMTILKLSQSLMWRV
ncbi:unnamed protein product [Phaedon cochleariae]|uniref:Uncharacterized protein n=1 Tax=Phaedon cochleariae TaxID=80249 RepID=A0A9N9X1S6_PHACE|nr:unnamed protein product [Phaedon cochleariae]